MKVHIALSVAALCLCVGSISAQQKRRPITRPVSVPDVICQGSPMPDGYEVVSSESLAQCGGNPLNNAFRIGKIGSAPAAPKTSARNYPERDDDSTPSVRITIGGRDEEKPKSILEQRAEYENKRAARSLAAANGEVSKGMTREQVIRALGRPSDYSKRMRSDGVLRETMHFSRNAKGGTFSSAEVKFENGFVTEWYLN